MLPGAIASTTVSAVQSFLSVLAVFNKPFASIKQWRLLLVAIALSASGLLCAAGLGPAVDYNALVFEHFTASSSDVEGRLAAGGDITINHYSVGDKLEPATAGDVLMAGGDIRFSSGRVYYGNIVAGGSIEHVGTSVLNGLEPGATAAGNVQLAVDFTALRTHYRALSQQLAVQPGNGSAEFQWGGYSLSGDCSSDLQVFSLDGVEVLSAHTFNVTCIPSGATVIFNISGTDAGLTNMSLSSLANRSEQVLFNFYEAQNLILQGISVEGSVLAPDARVDNPQGVIKGQIIAKSWNGMMQLNHRPFNGQLPGDADTGDDDGDGGSDRGGEGGGADNHDGNHDGQTPHCEAAYPSKDSLWPPNHTFSEISIEGLSDPNNDALTLTVQCIFQDEPLNSNGDGNTAYDGDNIGARTALLRRERQGGGNGRVYHIDFSAEDPAGNSCTGRVRVGVPHSKKATAFDDGRLYESVPSPFDCSGGQNNAPVITSDPVVAATVMTAYQYQVIASDSDGDMLIFSLTNAPAGMSIDAQNGLIEWTPAIEQTGAQDVTLMAEDGNGGSDTQNFSIVVTNPNSEPVITSSPVTTGQETELYQYNVVATDADGDALTYSLQQAPVGMAIDAASGLISWTPALGEEGEYTVSVAVDDDQGGSASQEYLLTINPNTPPQITSDAVTTAVENSAYQYSVAAEDAQGDAIAFSLVTAPADMTISLVSGVINWLPDAFDIGTHEITVRVTDTHGAFSEQLYTLTVSPRLNTAPVIVTTPTLSIQQGAAYHYDVDATDAEGDALTYTLLQAPGEMQMSLLSGLITWQPGFPDVGQHTVKVKVTDVKGAYTTQRYNLDVIPLPNNSPTITNTPVSAALRDTLYSYVVSATDPDGDVLVYSLEVAPQGMSISPQSGLISWVPDATQPDSVVVRVLVDDQLGGTDSQTFSIGIHDEQANLAPEIVSPAVTQVSEDALYDYDVEAVDPNQDVLHYRLSTGPSAMTINPANGALSWLPGSAYTQPNQLPLTHCRIQPDVDPLLERIEQAVELGADYVAGAANTWHSDNQCLGCHIQTQSLYGLAASIDKVDVDLTLTTNLYNYIAGSSQPDGRLSMSNSTLAKTQTSLGIWSLGTWPNPEQSFRARYRGLGFMWPLRNDSGTQISWTRDYDTGWLLADDEASTAIMTEAIVGLIEDGRQLSDVQVADYALAARLPLSGVKTAARGVYADGDALLIAKRGGIERFNPETGESELVYDDLLGRTFYDVVRASNGSIYALSSDLVVRVFPNGTHEDISMSLGPDGRMVEWRGEIYFSEPATDRIYRLNDGVPVIFTAGGLIDYPIGLTVSDDNELVVASYLTYSLVKVNAGGDQSTLVSGFPFNPISIANAGHNEYFVLTQRYSNDGVDTFYAINLVRASGTLERLAANRYEAGAMHDVALINGTAYISDTNPNGIWPLRELALDRSLLTTVEQELSKIADFFLSAHTNAEPETLKSAFRLIGLGELTRVIEDSVLQGEMSLARTSLDGILRARQNTDGGWGRYPEEDSDPLITAWAGLALDYLNPGTADPAVRAAIEYLLDSQHQTGDWAPLNFFTTNLGTTSLVMAYLPRVLSRFQEVSDVSGANIRYDENLHSLSFDVINRGRSGTSDNVTAQVYSGNTLLYEAILEPLSVDEQRTIVVQGITPEQLLGDVHVILDPDQVIQECITNNNEITAALIKVTADDPEPLSDQQTYLLNVHNINRSPQITSTVSSTTALIGQDYRYQVAAQDADVGDALQYSLTGAPAGMQIDPVSGLLTWQPDPTQAGVFTFTVVATDLAGVASEQEVTLTVEENLAPKITSAPVVAVSEGVTYNYPVDAQDPNADPLTYRLSAHPAGAGINLQSGVISWGNTNAFVESTTAFNTQCVAQPNPINTLDPVLKWQWFGTAQYPTINRVFGPVAVGQLSDDNADGDINEYDTPDLIFPAYDVTGTQSKLFVVSGDNGALTNTIESVPIGSGSVSLADIDGDGVIEILGIALDRTGVFAFEHTGEFKWFGSLQGGLSGFVDTISIADIDGNGTPELAIGNRLMDHQGNLLWEGAGDKGGLDDYGYVSLIADIDLDGSSEIIAGRTVYNADGSVKWHQQSAGSDGYTALANFDDDDFAEIVLVANGDTYLLDHDGEILWGPVLIPGGGVGGPPTIADVDGDGEPEITIAGRTQYVVFEKDGTIKWQRTVEDISSNRTGSSVFDFEADGKSEILYADENNFFIYDGDSGDVLYSIPNASGTALEYPVVADIDNDGHAEIIFASNTNADSGLDGIRVLEGGARQWASTRAIWNQHAYHITNINDDGTVPANEQPSWLTHNTYRLNTFPDRDPLSQADLRVGSIRYDEATQTLSAVISNRGLAPTLQNATVDFYSGNPGNAGTLLQSIEVGALDSGGQVTAALTGITANVLNDDIYTIVDAANTIDECLTDNNLASAALFNAQVQDPGGLSDTQIWLASITNVNDAPVIVGFPPGGITEGGLYQYALTINDPDGGDAHRYSLSNAPAGMTVNRSGLIEWATSAGDSGNYTLTVTVTDLEGASDAQTIDVVVTADPNTAPQITSSPVTGAEVLLDYSYAVTASDADGDSLTYALLAAPGGMRIDDASGLISWLPGISQSGQYVIVIQVRDARGQIAQQSYTLVVGTPDNDPPHITSTPVFSALVNQPYQYPITASDPDGDTLSYQLSLAPGGMSIDASGLVQWTPDETHIGVQAINVVVSDGFASVEQSYSLSVSDQPNNPPGITSTPVFTGREGDTYTYQVIATDPDGDSLAYELSQSPADMSIDSTGLITWAPQLADIGSHTVIVRVSDGHEGIVQQSYSLNIATNGAPVILSVPPVEGQTETLYEYSVVANDPDGDVIHYSLLQSPSGMSIDPINGQIGWTPGSTQAGVHSVSIQVSDTRDESSLQQFNIAVSALNIPNQPPVITSEAPYRAVADTTYEYIVEAFDPESEQLSYGLLNTPQGAVISASGVLTWQPAQGQVGIYSFSVRVTDPGGLFAEQVIEVFVTSENIAPTILGELSTHAKTENAYHQQVQAVDPEGDPLSYQLTVKPEAMVIDEQGLIQWSPTLDDVGEYDVTLVVSDDQGNSSALVYRLRATAPGPRSRRVCR